MKKYYVFMFIIVAISAFSQTIIFEDDFENGLALWTLETYPLGYNTWGLVDYTSHSPTHCLTESPIGNYEPNVTYTATITEPLDLSTVVEAELSFWMKYDVEFQYYDYITVEISPNNGVSWTNMGTYCGTGNNWEEYIFSLALFVGNPQVIIRWELVADLNQQFNGLCLDDVVVTDLNIDTTPPLIYYNGPEFYEGTDEDFNIEAEIIDVSGLASVDVIYTIEGGNEITIPSTGNTGDTYFFTIPFSNYGDQIDFKIVAVDASPNSNESESIINSIIYGHHLIYDNGQADFYVGIYAGEGVAVKMSNPTGIGIDLHYALIRNHLNSSISNSDMEFHVWDDNGGVPGIDLITPFMVTPEATLENNNPMTRIDLRPYSTQLSDIQGDFYIGFMVLTDIVHFTETSPGTYCRSFNWNGSTWTQDNNDFHLRSIVELIAGTVQGNVTDTDTGIAIEGATIVMSPYSTTTDANGDYNLDVKPGTYDLVCSYEGYYDYIYSDITFPPYDVITVDVDLQHMYNPPESLTYQVIAPDIALQWTAPIGLGLTCYNVYRNGDIISTVTELSYIDPNVPLGTYTYYVTAVYGEYESVPSNIVEVEIVESDPNLLPVATKLGTNYPNPFNPSTTISFDIKEHETGIMKIFNIKGQSIESYQFESGKHNYLWDASNQASGIYFYKLQTQTIIETKKMLLLK
ncbi:MAG: carboxypeptidase regulatory-like domain-containing protein [Candidatus Cloacimonetes bacterium]|jgi:hypothetical protein|nr:carboxypeptidase regulatory-like domain-containing protein [Candidatus Cloacimonadota bacterium]